jgi:cell division protein FtsB
MHLPPKKVKHHVKTHAEANGFGAATTLSDLETRTIEQPEIIDTENMETRPAIKTPVSPLSDTPRVRRKGEPVRGSARSSDSLPVLDAFQDFLAVERRRTKRRIIGLGFSFFAIILLVAAAGVGAGIFFLSPMRDDVSAMDAKVNSYTQQADALKSQTETSIETLSQVLTAEKTAISQAQSRAGTRMDDQSTQIEVLTDKLADLEKKNASLKEDLSRLSSDWPVMTSNYKRLMLDIERLKKAPRPAPPSVATMTRVSSTAVTEEATLVLRIRPPGISDVVSLRLPISE